jgi:hypothetical protein
VTELGQTYVFMHMNRERQHWQFGIRRILKSGIVPSELAIATNAKSDSASENRVPKPNC